MLKLTALLLIVIIACELNFCNAESNEQKALKAKKAKLNQFMKDLHHANNLDDLLQYNIKRKPSSFRTANIKAAPILGRSNYRAYGPLLAQEETIDATPGKCDPKLECISNPLTFNINSSQFAFPPCINIHRCSGCCPINENCVAIGTQEVKLQRVGVISFDNSESPEYDETSVVVTNHTECQCQCQWKTDEDCQIKNPNLIRNPQACECICPEKLYCSAHHQFDKTSCKCKCKSYIYGRLEQNCEFRGFYWNDEKCKCEARRSRRA